MLPLHGILPTISKFLSNYREIFCRKEGFEHVSRYIAGLLLSPNKTLQGIYAQQVWTGEKEASRRAMHESVFKSGWRSEEIMENHRKVIEKEHKGRGREVIGLDWTLSHHEKGEKIYGVKKAYDYVEKKMSRYQTVITATIANKEIIDGIEVVVQIPSYQKEELKYLKMTKKDKYETMEEVQKRLIELLSYQKNRLEYRKRTEIAVEIVRKIEEEGRFPTADYAFDNGVLTVELTRLIEEKGKHWVSEIECNRNINWQGKWRRVDEIASQLQTEHPETFRLCQVKTRNGENKTFWTFSKAIRLRKYGKKRLVIVHDKKDLSDTPRFLLTDALHWESRKVIETWSYRWPIEVFHEFAKQVTGFESSQVRNEEAVKRHFRLSCVAQSLLQRVTGSGGKSEKFEFAQGKQTIGQKLYSLNREAMGQLLSFAQGLFSQGHSCEHILEALMPI